MCTAPARLFEHVAPGVFTDFLNPQFPVLAVEPAASQVVDSFSSGVERVQFAMEPSAAVSFPAVDVSALPFLRASSSGTVSCGAICGKC